MNGYLVAAKLYAINNNSLYSRPTILFLPNGGEAAICKNNRFEIVFYDMDKTEMFSVTTTEQYYNLSENEWNLILAQPSDHFYCAIKSYFDDGYGYITGPYISKYYEITKPAITVIDLDNGVDGSITKSEDYTWFKFTAPTSGTYTFYTESSIDTYADMFHNPICGLSSITGRIANDDDSGMWLNFSITYEMDYLETVYIRVRGYNTITGDYTMHVDFVEHIHHYNLTCIPNDVYTHRCTCDCGLYEDIEHDWISLGTNRMKCMNCIMTIVGTVPGATISSIGDEAELTNNSSTLTMPTKKED